MQKNSVIDWSLIIAIGIAWGSSFLFIKVSAPEVGPITLVFSRLLIASLILTPFFIRRSNLKNLKEDFYHPRVRLLGSVSQLRRKILGSIQASKRAM